MDPSKAGHTLDPARPTLSTRCEELSEVLQDEEKGREVRPLKEHIRALQWGFYLYYLK